jgi:hypothetical protein
VRTRAYGDNYLIDLKAAISVDGEATGAIRWTEVGATKTMFGRTEQRFGFTRPGPRGNLLADKE